MDAVPGRRDLAGPYRAVLCALERRVPLPNINPNWYSTLGVTLSVLYLYAATPAQKIALIAIILVADWLDGATARRYARCCRAGYVIDVVTDRASEGFIFAAEAVTPVGQVFFLLWLLNIALAFYGMRTGVHTSLALRFALLVVLLVG